LPFGPGGGVAALALDGESFPIAASESIGVGGPGGGVSAEFGVAAATSESIAVAGAGVRRPFRSWATSWTAS